MQKPASLVKTAGRTLDLLELIIKSNKPLNFTEIKIALDIPKSSLHNLLQDLVNREYLTYESTSKQYSKGMRLIQYATLCINNTDTLREIWLGIKEISEEFGETAHAAVLDDRFITYISKAIGSSELTWTSAVGLRTPAHSTALGKVLLSELSDQEIKDIYIGVELEQVTPYTITNVDRLIEQIAKVRAEGYAFENRESVIQGACVSVPVLDNKNKIMYAMSMIVPAYKLNEEYKQEIIRTMKEVSKKMSIKLGYF